jgi:hypothetical protein
MSDQPTAQPSFHEAYDSLVAGLPASQLREAHKRLVKCKQPLTADELVSEHPRVLACLERIVAAYGRKKSRSAVASKVRRDAARDKPTAADADSEAPPPSQQADDSEPPLCELSVAMADVVIQATTLEEEAPPPPLPQPPAPQPPAPRPLPRPLPQPRARAKTDKPVQQVEKVEKVEQAGKGGGRKFFTNQTDTVV